MSSSDRREIPYNYTSADDAQIVRNLFGGKTWYSLEKLRYRRNTGRLARLLMRFVGDLFMVRRNVFVYQELARSERRRQRFLEALGGDLDVIEKHAVAQDELSTILATCREALSQLAAELPATKNRQQRCLKRLGAVVGAANVSFDPFSLIAHATDATDWRLHAPSAVVWPSTENDVPALLAAIQSLDMKAIPRGGGTGLTGGAVPVTPGCVVINTEKLNRIHGIETVRRSPQKGRAVSTVVIHLEAGVVTGDAMRYAEQRGYVFATDPTSSWACTIGGNIAENAGGKTAVLWGTAIDNLWSFRIVMPTGSRWEVQRIDHPGRKIRPEDEVGFRIVDLVTAETVETVRLKGTAIRKEGLGKDITNKVLGGVPGLQKEGTDGIITSAKFILHEPYPYKATACLEFFGGDMDEAARVIHVLSQEFQDSGAETLMALEHFDEEYVRAIGYKTKAPRPERPKAVLLVDVVGWTADQLVRAEDRLARLPEQFPNTAVFFAADPAEAERYWQDRKRLGAIAARTNAFKLNEDIVLPLAALAEFADYADRYNIEEERFNQRTLVWQLGDYLETAEPLADPQWLDAKIPRARDLLQQTLERLEYAGKDHLRAETHLLKLKTDLLELFRGYRKVSADIEHMYTAVRSHVIVIATHMHAGDGNVHVNIPVFSNDREMMLRAAETAEAVMAKARELGGVVSGEHGIGFTKLKFIDPDRLDELTRYRSRVDPAGLMNPGKLSDLTVPDRVFTPSFNLLGLEARILQHASLQELAGRISGCIRCGKCKPDCCMFYPARNLFFHPRNKNLAIAALIEAILYDTQRFRTTRFGFLSYLEDVADHCTICHKCAAPCPVDIDTGEVSILERRLLTERNVRLSPMLTRMTLSFLQSRSRFVDKAFRRVILRGGGRLQRVGSRLMRGGRGRDRTASAGRLALLLAAPITLPPPTSLYHMLPRCGDNQALVLDPPEKSRGVVFYFPGCGSERLFSTIGKAAVFILLRSGTTVILPPPQLCCGYPARVNGKQDMERRITLRDTIILNQIKEMFAHLAIDACAVSCGTCREALQKQSMERVFRAPMQDVAALALRNGIRPGGREYIYHRPCHDSMEGAGEVLLRENIGGPVRTVPGCCGEAGTLALSRPDISAAMRERKSAAMEEIIGAGGNRKVLLTNCPSCLQGLGRHPHLPVTPRHLAEELALSIGGDAWEQTLASMVKEAELIGF